MTSAKYAQLCVIWYRSLVKIVHLLVTDPYEEYEEYNSFYKGVVFKFYILNSEMLNVTPTVTKTILNLLS